MKKRLNAANNTPADTKHFAVAASADEVGLQLTKMKAELRKDNVLAKPRMFIFNEFSEAHTLVMRTYGNSKKKADQVKVQMSDQSNGLALCRPCSGTPRQTCSRFHTAWADYDRSRSSGLVKSH